MALSAARIGGTRAAIAVAGVLVAFATASVAWDPRNAPVLVLDLAVGLAFVGLAVVAVPFSVPVTVLSGAVALAWYAGTAWAPAVFWHRGALTWLLLAYPLLRPATRLEGIVAGAAIAISTVPFAWSNPIASAGIATVLGAVAAWSTASIRSRGRAAFTAHLALVAFAALILIGALIDASEAAGTALPFYVAYEITVAAIALALGAVLPRPSASAVADLVIDLDGTPDTSMRERLSRALGDRGVRIAYADATADGFRDADGRPLDPAGPASGRATTPILRSGRPVAIIEHDAASVTAGTLVDAIGSATAAIDEHEHLTAEIAAHVTEVEDARRRLARAADRERSALRSRLRTTVEEPLEGLLGSLRADAAGPAGAAEPADAAELAHAAGHADPADADADAHADADADADEPVDPAAPAADPAAPAAFARTIAILEGALVEVVEAGQGLRPRELDDGLGAAVRVLSERSPLTVDLSPGRGTRYAPEVESAMYAACSEALQNCAKHAGVDRAAVEIADADGSLVIRIRDAGAGGADPSRGRGLRGLADRVRAVGGDVHVESPPGSGTLVELTYRGEPS
ncbi:hypothetical protein GCM10017608_25750 [Agromyces luteolus]|uniref:histidine kinase n=1 Tax=Agromyces luteolus TaxID=88373 RepID=A0A7C9LEU8_9MICO|nr:ATP-binding protein [Agromyces luteolus]MUN08952.1 hypothetical protein [Agromyces luteolus]GLK28640.1 hypothetical protein GCM10017608_25750 [Agromyces luteolus]